jgi:hypothetical protein
VIEGAIFTALILVGIAFDSFKRGTLNIISPVSVMLFWCTILLVGRPAYIELTGTWWFVEYYAGERPAPLLLFEVFASTSLGILAWYTAFRSRAYEVLIRKRLPGLPVRTTHVVIVSIAFLIWGGYAFLRFKPIPIETGLEQTGSYLEDGNKFTETTAYVAFAWMCISTVIFLLTATFRRRLPGLLLLAVFSAAVFYGGWSRSLAIYATIGVCIIEALRRQRRIVLFAFIVLVPVLVPVFNELSADREYVQKTLRDEPTRGDVERWLPSEFSDLDAYVGVVKHVPDTLPFSYGADLLHRFVVNAVPRVLWKDKRMLFMPEDPLGIRGRLFAGGHVATVFGYLYLEGGILAIVLVLGLSGFLLRYLYEAALAHRENAYYNVLYVLLHLYFLSAWRDLYNPGYLLLTGVPLLPLFIVSYLLVRYPKFVAKRHRLHRALRSPRQAGPR